MTSTTASSKLSSPLIAAPIQPELKQPEFGGLNYPSQRVTLNDLGLETAAKAFFSSRKSIAKNRLKLNPSNPAILCQIGDNHMNANRLPRAKEAYLNALRMNPNFAPAYIKIINLLLLRKETQEAIKFAQRGLKRLEHNEQIWSHLLLARSLEQFEPNKRHDLDRLINDFEVFLAQYPNHSSTIRQFGIVLCLLKKDPSSAKTQFNKALSLNANDVDALNNLGLTYNAMSKPEKALEYIKKALSVRPTYQNGYQNILSISLEHKMYDEAVQTFSLARLNNVNLSEQLQLQEGWLLIKNKRYKEAVKWHKEITRKYPKSDMLYNNLGFAEEQIGELKDALDSYGKAVTLAINQKIFNRGPLIQFYNRMILAKAMGENEKVEETARELMKINPKDQAAYYFLGDGDFGKHTAALAKTTLEKTLKLQPHDLSATENLSFIYCTIDRDYHKTIKLILDTPTYHESSTLVNNLAYSYLKTGNIDKANKTLKKIKLADKNNPFIIATQGLESLYRGNISQAQRLYSTAIKKLTNSKDYAEQVWEIEQANYYIREQDYKSAKRHLARAEALGDVSYFYQDIERLMKSVEKRLK